VVVRDLFCFYYVVFSVLTTTTTTTTDTTTATTTTDLDDLPHGHHSFLRRIKHPTEAGYNWFLQHGYDEE